MIQLNFTYDVSAHQVLNNPDVYNNLKLMRDAGVSMMYIFGYFTGHYESTLDEIAEAKRRLEDLGLETGILNIPVGHGGNALTVSEESIDLSIGNGWRHMVEADGTKRENAACIENKMITDNAQANIIFYQMGFRRFINDDDLRQGHWGQEIQGCYCSECMKEFCAATDKAVTPQLIASNADKALTEAWMDFQCGKVIRFLKETIPQGAQGGCMIMPDGDKRHALDVARIAKELPDIMIRIGEGRYADGSMQNPEAVDGLKRSICRHLALIDNNDRCYSETTSYPYTALSPANMIKKIEIEIECGLRNIYLMSGADFLLTEYWHELKKQKQRLEALANSTPYPKHTLPEFNYIW